MTDPPSQARAIERARVTIVLPAFNEGPSLGGVLDSLGELRDSLHGWVLTAVVVDDGSVDDTSRIAARGTYRISVNVLENGRNIGLGGTFRRGLLMALEHAQDGDVVVVMDADGTHPVKLLPAMVEMVRKGHDVVIASRFAVGGCEIGVPAHRRLLSRGMSRVFRAALALPGVTDYSSGYRAYSASMLMRARVRLGEDLFTQRGFECMVDVLIKLHEQGAVCGEVPMTLRYDHKQSKSQMPIVRTLRDTLVLLRNARRRRRFRRHLAANENRV